MIEIPDLELAVRLGAPALPAAEEMRGVAAAAARKHRLGAEDVTDVVRALHWLALGNPEHARSADMVGALLLVPRTAETCHRLGAADDYVYAATVDHRR